MKTVVIALGGNALQSKDRGITAEDQLEIVKNTVKSIVESYKSGSCIAIVHGNGPQVGRILLAGETAKNVTPAMPFDVCGAMSEGYIGYHIQQALSSAFRAAGITTPVATVVTQMTVDADDPAFLNPTKPIGPFYSEQEARVLADEKGYTVKEDAGRGWRRVVASPKPRRIVEMDAIRTLSESAVVISCGGGGVPVIEQSDGSLSGVAAVIDKDFAAELLAEQLNADMLLILTEVERAAINWGKPGQQWIDTMNTAQAKAYSDEGQFAPGSMLPKVQAGMMFVENHPERQAVITDLDHALAALENGAGTHIVC